jgi:hypothetical protein
MTLLGLIGPWTFFDHPPVLPTMIALPITGWAVWRLWRSRK